MTLRVQLSSLVSTLNAEVTLNASGSQRVFIGFERKFPDIVFIAMILKQSATKGLYDTVKISAQKNNKIQYSRYRNGRSTLWVAV